MTGCILVVFINDYAGRIAPVALYKKRLPRIDYQKAVCHAGRSNGERSVASGRNQSVGTAGTEPAIPNPKIVGDGAAVGSMAVHIFNVDGRCKRIAHNGVGLIDSDGLCTGF